MTLPLWVTHLAHQFWQLVGEEEPFPRMLRKPITRTLPLAVVFLPSLSLETVRAWLRQNYVACPCYEEDRALRGCLVSRCGQGFVFLEDTDTDQEQRFSLAHELAHFLRDYWEPRQRASRRLGEQITEVFDGYRPPTHTERFHALVANVPLGFHFHLLQRENSDAEVSREVSSAEQEADMLAYELLAPANTVLNEVNSTELIADIERREKLISVLVEHYGLPSTQARVYGEILVPPQQEHPLLRLIGKK